MCGSVHGVVGTGAECAPSDMAEMDQQPEVGRALSSDSQEMRCDGLPLSFAGERRCEAR